MNGMKQQATMMRVIVTLISLSLLSACSDGNGVDGIDPGTVVPVAAKINSLTIAPVGENATGELPLRVEAGTDVLVQYDVSGAQRVELSSANASFETQALTDMKGSFQFTVLQHDTITLTAYAEGASAISKRVTVEVIDTAPAVAIVNFAPSDVSVELGTAVTLCFEVMPADAVVVMTNVDTNEQYTEFEDVEPYVNVTKSSIVVNPGAAMAAVAGGSAEAITSAADVRHACSEPITAEVGEHRFRLDVSNAEGESVSKNAAFEVVSALAIESFLVDGETSVALDAPGSVTLSWVVKPADATVTISDGTGVDEGTTNDDGSGHMIAKVDQDTLFTITVTDASGETLTRTVIVTIKQTVATPVSLSVNTQNIFDGEAVVFTIESDATQLGLVTPDGTVVEASSGANEMAITQSGAYQAVEILDDGSVGSQSNAVSMTVRSWDAARGSAMEWNAVAVSSAGEGHVLVGQSDAANDVAVGRLDYRNAWSERTVSFVDAFKVKVGDMNNNDHLQRFGPFSAQSMAFDVTKNDGQRAYMGMNGVILFSRDAGQSWKTLTATPVYDYGDYKSVSAEHASCRGMQQAGVTGKYTPLVSLRNSCAIAVDVVEGAGDRLLVASDQGMFYVDDVDAYIAGEGDGWKGNPKAEDADPSRNLYNMLVHDIAAVSGDVTTYYAATEHGVYVNAQRGEVHAWEAFNSAEIGAYDRVSETGDAKAVYAIAVDEVEQYVYAATSDGHVYRSKTRDANWTAYGMIADGAKIYSLAVDQTNGAVIAATSAGVYLSRDAAESWVDISASTLASELVVRDVAVTHDSAGASTYALATEQGVFVSSAAVAVVEEVTEESDPDEEEESDEEELVPLEEEEDDTVTAADFF